MRLDMLYKIQQYQESKKENTDSAQKQPKNLKNLLFKLIPSFLKKNNKKKNERKNKIKKEEQNTKQKTDKANVDDVIPNLNLADLAKQKKNKSTNNKSKKKRGFLPIIIVFIVLVGGYMGYLKYTLKKQVRNNKTQINPIKKQPARTQQNIAPTSTVVPVSKNKTDAFFQEHNNDKELASIKPSKDLLKKNTLTKQALFKTSCAMTKQKVQQDIDFILQPGYQFEYLGKKYKIGDIFDGAQDFSARIDNIYYTDADHKKIVLRDTENPDNTCSLVLSWHQGYKMNIYFDAVVVTEKYTGNKHTFLIGQKIGKHNKLIKIDDNTLTAYFQTPKGVSLIRGTKQ